MGDYARLMKAVSAKKGACSLIWETLNIVSFFIELHTDGAEGGCPCARRATALVCFFDEVIREEK